MAGSECADQARGAGLNQRVALAGGLPPAAAVMVGEYSVPVDPMDDLQCDSCQ